MSTQPAQVARFRARYRASRIGPRYSGRWHTAAVSFVSLGIALAAASRVRGVLASELLAVPLAFVVANWIEYASHRWLMHRRVRKLEAVVAHHSNHHRFFTRAAMAADSAADFKLVLFQPRPVLLFLLFGVAGLGSLLSRLGSPNAAWLYVATAMTYFVTQEWVHLASHVDERSWIGRLPFMAALRRHHTLHHDPRLMGRWNYNIVFPLFDLLCGTLYAPERMPSPSGEIGGAS